MNIHEKINVRSYMEPQDQRGFRVTRYLDPLKTEQPCANDSGWQHVKKVKLFKLKF